MIEKVLDIHRVIFWSKVFNQKSLVGKGDMCISRFLATFLLFFPNIVNVAYVDNFNVITFNYIAGHQYII